MGKLIVVQERFLHGSPTIRDMPELLGPNGGEVGVVVIRERGKVVCLPGCRLFRLRETELPHFPVYPVFPVFNCLGDGPPPFARIPESFCSAQSRFARIRNPSSRGLHHAVQVGWVWVGES
jgi:hypothetical protein